MSGFETASLVETRGMAILMPWLEERAYRGRVVTTAKGRLSRYVQRVVGDVVLNPAREPDRLLAVEIKCEENDMPNLFLEVWSNRNLRTRQNHADLGMNGGWMMHSRADVLLYYQIQPDRLTILDLFALKRWAFGGEDGSAPQGPRFPLKKQNRYQQTNDSWGRCVPIAVLEREVGARITSVQKLEIGGSRVAV